MSVWHNIRFSVNSSSMTTTGGTSRDEQVDSLFAGMIRSRAGRRAWTLFEYEVSQPCRIGGETARPPAVERHRAADDVDDGSRLSLVKRLDIACSVLRFEFHLLFTSTSHSAHLCLRPNLSPTLSMPCKARCGISEMPL